jgi:hypothetical protein
LTKYRKKKVTPKTKEIVAQGAQPPILTEKEFVSGIKKSVSKIPVIKIKT